MPLPRGWKNIRQVEAAVEAGEAGEVIGGEALQLVGRDVRGEGDFPHKTIAASARLPHFVVGMLCELIVIA
jgi:hypothetical protein